MSAGVVPCDLVNIATIADEFQFYYIIEDLYNHVKKSCNNKWENEAGMLLDRLKNSLTCDGGFETTQIASTTIVKGSQNVYFFLI